MKKKLLVALSLFFLSAGIFCLSKRAYAFWPFSKKEESKEVNDAQIENKQIPPLIKALAEKFNLNLGEVENFLNEYRQKEQKERQERMRTQREKRLNKMVEEGKITNEQKELLLQKEEELWQKREQERKELEKWRQDNKIDIPFFGFGGKGAKPRMKGW